MLDDGNAGCPPDIGCHRTALPAARPTCRTLNVVPYYRPRVVRDIELEEQKLTQREHDTA